MSTNSFMQMNVWIRSHEATLAIYKMTLSFPSEERYGLVAQMRRAAVSIPSNIAEGYGRQRAFDKARFYNISQGSTEELKYQVILARDLGYVANIDQIWSLLKEVSRMLRRLVQATIPEHRDALDSQP